MFDDLSHRNKVKTDFILNLVLFFILSFYSIVKSNFMGPTLVHYQIYPQETLYNDFASF